MNGLSIAGRKRSYEATKNDFYQTPKWAIEELLKRETLNGSILEPCSGAGAISKVLECKYTNVISSDIREDDEVYGVKGVDIFKREKHVDNIITNPPYKFATEIVEKSLEIANKKVVMFLKLSFLESVKRYELFKKTPLKTVYVFSKRVNPYPEGTVKPKNSGTIAYAWYVWEKGYNGKPQIEWIL